MKKLLKIFLAILVFSQSVSAKGLKPIKSLELNLAEDISVLDSNANLNLKLETNFKIKSVKAKFIKVRETKKAKKRDLNQKTKFLELTELGSNEYELPIDLSDKELGEWFLNLRITSNKGRKITLKNKHFRRLNIRNSFLLTDDPIETEETEEPEEENPEEDDSEEETSEDSGAGGTNPPPAPSPSPVPEPVDPVEEPAVEEPAVEEPAEEPVDEFIEEIELPEPDSQLIGESREDILSQQENLDQEIIDEARSIIVRARVFDENKNPLPGVKVSVHGKPEFGSTQTLANGEFNLVVNGGRTLVFEFKMDGCLTVQRSINVPRGDFLVLDDIILTHLDDKVTEINLNDNSKIRVAESSETEDLDGKRKVTLLFKPNTQATMKMADGTVKELTNVNVRATEFTVGRDGPQAMPGSLPTSSGYTYAVELSVDEAIEADAVEVDFTQPLLFYVDNYLGFPTGEIVPMGFYDREKAAWIASDNGRIIEILDIEDAKAVLDIDGSGEAASPEALADLGIDQLELAKLAELYDIGMSLWRVPIPHFTPWDCNWPFGPPLDAINPPPKAPKQGDDNQPDDKCKKPGSIIECQNQTFGESLNITGTPYTLEYRSDRVRGRRTGRVMDIAISDENIPESLKAIKLEIQIAGRKIVKRFDPEPNLNFKFIWDGRDAYGNEFIGSSKALVKVKYMYDLVYFAANDDFQRAFGAINNDPADSNVRVIGTRGSTEVALERVFLKTLTNDSQLDSLGLGGWSISSQHFYDATQGKLFFGNGDEKTAQSVPEMVDRIFNLNGQVDDISFNAEGNLYILDNFFKAIRKVDKNGVFTNITKPGFSGSFADNIPASETEINHSENILVGPDGSIYFSEILHHKVRKISPDGIITTVAGSGEQGFANPTHSGDGGLATEARIFQPMGMDLDKEGNLYLADSLNHVIRKVDRDGIITTVVGVPNRRGFTGDGVIATSARLNSPDDVKVAPDGSLYIADTGNKIVRKVDPQGIVRTIAGVPGLSQEHNTKEGVATAIKLDVPRKIKIDSQENIYILDGFFGNYKKVDSNGFIRTIVGGDDDNGDFTRDKSGVAITAKVHLTDGLTLDPDENIYVATDLRNIYKLVPGLPNIEGAKSIPSDDAKFVYNFDEAGKHISTINTLTGATKEKFEYDANGFLIAIENGDGDRTVIERNGKDIIAIISPDGLRTDFTLNADGYIKSVTNPNGETFTMSYSNGGLMESFTDPNNNSSTVSYTKFGRLKRDTNPAGGFWELNREELEDGYVVTAQTAKGRTIKYKAEGDADNNLHIVNRDSDGSVVSKSDLNDGTSKTTKSDGTIVEITEGPDPRFNMLAPVLEETKITTPSGLSSNLKINRTVSLNNSRDPLSLKTLTQSVNKNGKEHTMHFNKATKEFTLNSAEARSISRVIDDQGRTLEEQLTGIAKSNFTYDERGRLISINQGEAERERITNLSYDENGYLEKIIDPLGQETSFIYDNAGRVLKQKFHSGREIDFSYDPKGNLETLKPPSKPEHGFSYTAVDLEQQYLPPLADNTEDLATNFNYNLDKELTKITRADGKEIKIRYGDNSNKLREVIIDRGNYEYNYKTNTKQLKEIIAPNNEKLSFKYDGFLNTQESYEGSVNADIVNSFNNDFNLTQRCIDLDKNLDILENCINFSYDNDELMIKSGDLDIKLSAENTLINATTLNEISTEHGYNEFGELKEYKAKFQDNEIFKQTFTRDKLGRIVTKEENIQGELKTYSYEYDSDNRLSKVTENGISRDYTYDENGNRLDANYDDQDRLISKANNNYSYTAHGELLTKRNGDQLTIYNYDSLGNLINVTLPNKEIEYIIDGKNRRIGRKVNGIQAEGLVYKDQLNPIAQLDATGNLRSRFIYGTKMNVPEYMIFKPGTLEEKKYKLISDNLGSVRLVVDSETGEVVQRLDYDEWGRVTRDSNPGFQPFGFAGGLYDADTGLVRFGARDYDAELGRWTAKDPIRFDGGQANLYVYVGNDPVNFVDPTGLKAADWWDLPAKFHSAKEIGNQVSDLFRGHHNDAGDAMRHAEWSKRMTEELGMCFSAAAGTGHEIAGTLRGQPIDEALMDLHNNAIGRNAGASGNTINPGDLMTSPPKLPWKN